MIDLSSKALPWFITFEGGEGCGKSSQLQMFYKWFSDNYGPAIMTREPGGEVIAERIREILLDKDNRIEDLTELLLYEAARTQFVANILRPNFGKGISVLCDRFYDSTTAYQGYARGLSLGEVNHLNHLVTGGLNPDLTFILDIDPVAGLNRAGMRGEKDRIEKETIEFHQKVRNGYLKIAEDNLNRCVVIPSQDGIGLVQDDLRREFCKITGKPYETGKKKIGRPEKGYKDEQLGLFGN